MTNDGLVAFQRVGGPQGAAIVPDLATSIPRPSDGGKTYTFQLRSGIRYSDGTPVRADDFRLALERMFAQGGDSPSTSRGSWARKPVRRDPATCDLSDGVVTNDAAATVDVPSHGARSRTALRPRDAGRVRRPARHAEVADHDHTDPRDRPLPHHVVRAGQARFDPARA